MSIIVIEEGAANGTDLVVNEARNNPLARAKAEGRPIQEVFDLGDDFALAGVAIRPVFDETKENLCFILVAAAGPVSKLVGVQAVPVIVGELARVPIAELKAKVKQVLQPEPQ